VNYFVWLSELVTVQIRDSVFRELKNVEHKIARESN
jgi:hypothetical protein